MDLYQALVGTSTDPSSTSFTPAVFGVSQHGGTLVITRSPDSTPTTLLIKSCFQDFNDQLLSQLRKTSDTLNSETCNLWLEVYKGLYNLRLMWVHLMEMKSFRDKAKKAYPEDLVTLLVSYIQCKVASIKIPDFSEEKERNLKCLRMMTRSWNQAFRLMILICTNTKSSEHHIYAESVISALIDHMKDEGNEFIINFTAAASRILEVLRKAAVIMKDSESNLLILDVIREVEVMLSHLNSLTSSPLIMSCMRNAIPDKLLELLTSGLELIQHPIQLPVNHQKAVRVRTGKVRVVVSSTMAFGGLERIAARCLVVLSQLQDSHISPTSFQKMIKIKEIESKMIQFSALIWETAEVVLRRPPLSECPVYRGESQLLTNLLIVLPEIALTDSPVLPHSEKGVSIIVDILSSKTDQFASMWCGGVASKVLISEDPDCRSRALGLCSDYKEQEETLQKALSNFKRTSGGCFVDKDNLEELERPLGLLKLIAALIKRFSDNSKKRSKDRRHLHEMVSAYIQSKSSEWNERYSLAKQMDENIYKLVNFLDPVIGEAILPKESSTLAEKLGMDIRQDINRLRP